MQFYWTSRCTHFGLDKKAISMQDEVNAAGEINQFHVSTNGLRRSAHHIKVSF